MQAAEGEYFSSRNDAAPEVVLEKKTGKARVVLVTRRLVVAKAKDSGIRLRTRYEYRWGYVKIRREFVFGNKPIGLRVLKALSATFDPSLEQYGYRQGIGEQAGVSPLSCAE